MTQANYLVSKPICPFLCACRKTNRSCTGKEFKCDSNCLTRKCSKTNCHGYAVRMQKK